MKILAIETSCERGSVALRVGDAMLVRSLAGSGAGHSATALPALRELLAEAGLGVRDLDAIAFGAGPGAFTGLRLACGIAQGLAVGADLPVAPIGSLLALAADCPAAAIYCAMDARMGEAYVAAYQRPEGSADTLLEVLPPVCVKPAEAPCLPGGEWVGVGTAFMAYPALAQTLAACLRTQQDAVPTAASVARLAAQGEGWIDAALASPLYVRDKVAFTTAERLAAGGRA